MNRNKVSQIIIIISVYFVGILTIIVAGNCYIKQQEKIVEIEYQRNIELYNQALDCIDKEDWERAKSLLEGLPSDVCPQSLRYYVEARIIYDPNDIDNIKKCQSKLSLMYDLKKLDTLTDEITAFIEEVDEQYKILRRKELENVIPYIGMSEADLCYTALGKQYYIKEKTDFAMRVHKTYYYLDDGYVYYVYVASPADELERDDNKIVMDVLTLPAK